MTTNKNLRYIFNEISQPLQSIYSKNEAESIAFLLIEHLYKATRTQILVDKIITNFDEILLQTYIDRLLKNEPIQYLIGQASFYGYDFFVNSYTLIPRQETEELVNLIIKENNTNKNLKIIDIGTGTACIPISLFLNLVNPNIYAVDIDKNTLLIAQKNATTLQTNITFIEADILLWKMSLSVDLQENLFDIIVSNPPYIRELEKTVMHQNVLAYEPEKALFVPNENPLLFYDAIADFALKNLVKKGKLYFEINQALGQETKAMLEQKGFQEVEIIKDINENDRICRAILNFDNEN
jgi:release factor glutamine methyltransferase